MLGKCKKKKKHVSAKNYIVIQECEIKDNIIFNIFKTCILFTKFTTHT